MRLRYSVSFESDIKPVLTARGEIIANKPRSGVYRAVEAARKQYPNAHWRSLVVVLEKLGAEMESEDSDSGSDTPGISV